VYLITLHSFFLSCYVDHRDLHSFPTRRSSDLIFVGAVCGSLIGPRPVAAVAREIIDLQRDVTSLLQGQKDLSTQMTQDHTVIKRSEEHTSELQSLAYLVCRLLLEKKK